MPIFGPPVTPDPLPVWFASSGAPTYAARTSGQKLTAAAQVTPELGGGGTGGGYQAFTEPLEEMPSTWPDDLLAMVQVDDPPEDPFVESSAGGNMIRWTIDQFTDGFLDLSESVAATVNLNRGVPRGWEPAYDINLQNVPFPPWSPFYSGITTPEGAIGWEVVEDGEILAQTLTVYHGGLVGFVDDLQIAVTYADIDIPDANFENKYALIFSDASTVALLAPSRADAISGDTGIVKDLPVDFRPTSAGTLLGLPTPAVLPTAAMGVGVPGWLPGVETDELNPAPWAWRFEVVEGENRTESMRVDARAVFDYNWQPPVFRWIFEGSTPAPPLRRRQRDDGALSAPRRNSRASSQQRSLRNRGYL